MATANTNIRTQAVDGFLDGVGHGGPDTRCDLTLALSSSSLPHPVSLPSGGVQCPHLPHIDKLVSPNACFPLVLARSAQHSQNNVLIVQCSALYQAYTK